VLLLVPVYSSHNAWSRLAAYGAKDTFHLVNRDDAQEGQTRQLDPLFEMAACRFDLDDGPMHISASGHVPFWSLSVYSRIGQNVYSFNDRSAIDGSLDIVLAQPLQRIELEKSLPKELAQSVIAETDIHKGFIVVRSFVPDATWRTIVTDFLKSARCERLPS
jgi:uncharacterized membrane protein